MTSWPKTTEKSASFSSHPFSTSTSWPVVPCCEGHTHKASNTETKEGRVEAPEPAYLWHKHLYRSNPVLTWTGPYHSRQGTQSTKQAYTTQCTVILWQGTQSTTQVYTQMCTVKQVLKPENCTAEYNTGVHYTVYSHNRFKTNLRTFVQRSTIQMYTTQCIVKQV